MTERHLIKSSKAHILFFLNSPSNAGEEGPSFPDRVRVWYTAFNITVVGSRSIPFQVSSEIKMHAVSASIAHCTEDPISAPEKNEVQEIGKEKT